MAVYSDVIEMLDAHGIMHKRARGDEIRIGCLYHGTDNSMHMYINTAQALFLCHRCGEKGNAKRLAKELGDVWDGGAFENHEASGSESFFSKLDIYNDAALWYQGQLDPAHYSYTYLTDKRGLTKETIEKARIGYAPNGGGLFGHLRMRGHDRDDIVASGLVNDGGGDFFRDKIVIPYFASGFCVQLRGKDINGKYLTPPDQDARLYGLDEVKEAEEVILTEGEFDALSLRQLGFAAVSCPGAGLFKEEWSSWFENYRRIYICFDPDEAGKAGAERTQQILGRRTRVVELPDCDVNDWMVAGGTYDDFLELLRTSAGRRLRRLGDVRKSWEHLKHMEEGIYMGLDPRVDALLKPGFQRGQFIVLLAKTGAGKSISMLNIAYRNKHVPQILVSLEQTSEEMYERMRRISLFFNPSLDEAGIEEEWKNVLITDENKLTSREFEDLIFEYEEEMGKRPHLVWVDYLGYFSRSYKGEEYQRLSDAVMDLKAMAKKNKVIIFSPHQVNRSGQDGRPLASDNARGSGVIEETGDFVFALWRPNEAEQNAGTQPGEVAIRILKSRHGGKGSQFTMIQAPQSLAYVSNDGGYLEQQAVAEYAQMEKKLLFDDIHELRRARHFHGSTHVTLSD